MSDGVVSSPDLAKPLYGGGEFASNLIEVLPSPQSLDARYQVQGPRQRAIDKHFADNLKELRAVHPLKSNACWPNRSLEFSAYAGSSSMASQRRSKSSATRPVVFAAGERIQNHVTRFGQEPDVKLR